MSSTGTITEARKATGDDATPNINGREFQRWLVSISTDSGATVKTDILRKPESDDPTGSPAYSQEKGGRVRWKAGTQQQSFNGGGGGSGGWTPEKEKRVARQSAQQRAALFVIAKALITQEQAEFNLTKFREIVDWCSDDAEAAAQK